VARTNLISRLRAKVVDRYRRYEQRDARLQEAMSERGVGAFLSGHDGWFFHRGIPEKHDKRD
jgi:hypothetical protein